MADPTRSVTAVEFAADGFVVGAHRERGSVVWMFRVPGDLPRGSRAWVHVRAESADDPVLAATAAAILEAVATYGGRVTAAEAELIATLARLSTAEDVPL